MNNDYTIYKLAQLIKYTVNKVIFMEKYLISFNLKINNINLYKLKKISCNNVD